MNCKAYSNWSILLAGQYAVSQLALTIDGDQSISECRIEELELTITTREDVISHLNQDVEKLLLELRSLGQLKVAGEQQAKSQLEDLKKQATCLTQDKQDLQEKSDRLENVVSSLQEVRWLVLLSL